MNDMETSALMPPIKNAVTVGAFTLFVYAYRAMTQTELKNTAAMWLRKSGRRQYPKSGTAVLITTIGFDAQ